MLALLAILQSMKVHKDKKTTPLPDEENPRAVAVKRILNIAQLIRQRGSPDQADEAINWEKLLEKRLKDIVAEESTHQQAA